MNELDKILEKPSSNSTDFDTQLHYCYSGNSQTLIPIVFNQHFVKASDREEDNKNCLAVLNCPSDVKALFPAESVPIQTSFSLPVTHI